MSEYKEMNIFEKMDAITDELGVVKKDLDIKIGNGKSYKAVGERLILDAVKPLEHKYGVYSYPAERKVEANEVLTNEKNYNGTVTKSNSTLMRISTVYRFVNVDKPSEYIEVGTFGDGIDTGDKAPGKAMTYADKYALMKAYKIATGDDPDQDPSPTDPTKELTPDEAEHYVFTFGKYKGQKITDVIAKDGNYIEWLAQNGQDEIKEIIALLFAKDDADITTEIDERTIKTIESLAQTTNTTLEKVLENYGINDLSELTAEQSGECVRLLNEKRLRQEKAK